MNVASCQRVMEGVGSGVAASLRAVDCAAGATAEAAFGRLFGTEGALLPALTILLTIYVALFAYTLITGRGRMGISALTPRMVTVGLVLTFATSWIAYQGVVWNLAVGAPNEIASYLMGTTGSATDIFAQKIDVVFAALIETSGAQGLQEAPTAFSPQGLMWLGGTLLLLGTVGLLATCKIALAVLLALGPVFVVLALFKGTRGLFTGWLKGVVLLALAPLFAVFGGSLTLELAVPVLRSLTQIPGQIDERSAMAFFMIGAVHVALMVMVLKVAGSMVAGWTVFGLAGRSAENRDRATDRFGRPAPATLAVAPAAQAPATSTAGSREIRLTPGAMVAANDSGSAQAGTHSRETRILAAQSGSTAEAAVSAPSRTRGIGSRFRGPQSSARPQTSPGRPMEKFQ